MMSKLSKYAFVLCTLASPMVVASEHVIVPERILLEEKRK
jgi:hypothetical protein